MYFFSTKLLAIFILKVFSMQNPFFLIPSNNNNKKKFSSLLRGNATILIVLFSPQCQLPAIQSTAVSSSANLPLSDSI